MNKKTKTKRPNRRWLVLLALLIGFGALVYFLKPEPGQLPAGGDYQPSGSQAQPVEPVFDKSKYPLDEPDSLWVIVNKGRKLPASYVPDDLVVPDTTLRYSSGSEMQLRADAAKAVKEMFAAARSDNRQLMVASGFRTYSLQSAIFNRHVNELGRAGAEAVSARPGHSEHQTGWAVDIAPADGRCLIEECFGNTAEGRWLAKNAHKYGFIMRYGKNNQSKTGYSYEPWHFRFVGKELAAEVFAAGVTLEEFFDLPLYDGYPDQPQQL